MSESREEDREPDFDEDPRKSGVGQSGYPEESPSGGGDAESSPEGGDARESDGASSGASKDSPPSKATGNPDAAGG